jgi:aspartyl/asparaginyl beta-hydroxylase (cupin superfamily)
LLIRKADTLREQSQSQLAIPFYRAALRGAAARPQPPLVVKDLQRVQAICDRYAKEYETYIHEKLAAQGFGQEQLTGRFAQALDLMFGRKQIYLQQPSVFYFPGLTQTQFFDDRSLFPWLDALEKTTDDIRAELVEAMKQKDGFVPYIESDVKRPPRDYQGLADSLDWSAFYLWKNGEPVEDNIRRCPKTMQALANVPLDRIPRRTPSILFSVLRANSRIPPHNGFLNTRLICHLPLIVPPGCGFRVGNDVREWKEGKAWVFDDTIEHEAWNDSDQTRVILLFDIWRPDISEEERRMIATMLEAVVSFGAAAQDWSA